MWPHFHGPAEKSRTAVFRAVTGMMKDPDVSFADTQNRDTDRGSFYAFRGSFVFFRRDPSTRKRSLTLGSASFRGVYREIVIRFIPFSRT